MYNLKSQQFEYALDVLIYTVNAMKECDYSSNEIEDYLYDATSDGNYHLVNSSLDTLNECNKVYRKLDDINDNDYWKEYYYCNDLDDDIDCCDYEGHPFHIWEVDNVVDDVETEDELEAYEGFNCCKNHQYICDLEDDSFDEDIFNYMSTKK